MLLKPLAAIGVIFALSLVDQAQTAGPTFTTVGPGQTAAALGLTSKQEQAIADELESDPDGDWDHSRLAQLRYSRVALTSTPKEDAIVVTSRAPEDCGGTGNCAYWILRVNGEQIQLLLAAFGDEVGIQERSNNGLRNVVVVGHLSADADSLVMYAFDGETYQPSECYERTGGVAGKLTSFSSKSCDSHASD